ncbi:MAG TPA: outer membrane lipoprotein carrier protein LolA [Nitrosomonas nitrosa]|uniref:outer membrane lipoprotein chaperone LolA n=1 Tax=Nitrosomonas nitrosa TaxID=52442 RepID=UPI000D317FEE|nr:outer membrane lipoprotein chaperone LolA [Nitrosomonas nitrosa]PTR02162.1 outer membrane lipoprotein carrier protein [Nitrosomonas nitrosa]HBZ31361.1 outer membrane lipoprotein carrier protein LolA [Nitrosomonas nitrosa]HNP52045.1 outer membrane lipoprotein chaperone LolA [Nitrosomonas nitrosa]
MSRFILILLFFLFSQLTYASAIDSLRSFVQQAHTFKAVFSQTLLDKNLQVMQEASGTMMFERPGKFRWVYEKPYQQLIVGDGSRVWFYDQDLNQVTVRQLDLAIGSSPAALLAGSSTIERDFELTDIDVQDDMEWLEATPRAKESTFELIRMGFSKAGELREMVLRDNFGQFTLLVFTDLDANLDLSPDLFQFTPPEGADVISD